MQRQRSALESHHLHQIERSSGSSISSSGLLPGANPGAQPPPPPQSLIPPEILRNRDIAKIPSTALPPAIVTVGGQTLIAPNSKLARAIVMGNDVSSAASETNGICIGRQEEVPVQSSNARSSPSRGVDSRPSAGALSSPNRQNLVEYVRPMSNLSVLLNQQQQQHHRGGAEVGEERHSPLSDRPSGLLHRHRALSSSSSSISQNNNNNYVDEADSASGPAPALSQFTMQLGRSAPNVGQTAGSANFLLRPPPPPPPLAQVGGQNANFETVSSTDNVRRCLSSKELGGTLAPPSGSPYAFFLHKKEELEVSMRNRLEVLREAENRASSITRETGTGDELQTTVSNENRKTVWESDISSNSSRTGQRECGNELRNRRRAEHAKAVLDDLCEVVTDLFVAESKLLDPRNYGVPHMFDTAATQYPQVLEREHVLKTVRAFVSSLPLRYALGVETPSEVLLHMRLMAATRTDKTKAVLHIHNLAGGGNWSQFSGAASARESNTLRLVTISCHDATGLLEYISKLLATSGSRVLDADVMLSTDGIVLDRFVVEMTGRLRLDKMVNLVEAFLREAVRETVECNDGLSEEQAEGLICLGRRFSSASNLTSHEFNGPLYIKTTESVVSKLTYQSPDHEIKGGIPLSEVLASNSQANLAGLAFPQLKKLPSLPGALSSTIVPSTNLQMRDETAGPAQEERPRERRSLVNRRASSNLDRPSDSYDDLSLLDYLSVPVQDTSAGVVTESRNIPLIPFNELMLIETIGTGRVSTIYRAAWQRGTTSASSPTDLASVRMVALKVAMVNALTGDQSHVNELRQEADIAARLEHPNICDLVGVAADPECFCLAYEFCEGGSLLALLSDPSRYYEYLPIALDIVQGMAFLHSRSIIHRDLKPSNILLTRDHRAKVADFGMSISNYGQELTAETGTYRYMAPEVIRHESYSSNADVYSFGLCLWQLISREVPFATMTPIQAAYAVAEGHRPEIPSSTPLRLQEIIRSCWDQDSHKRPSFTYIAMALADYAKLAFSPANVGTLTLQIANEMLATVEGNSTVNVDFSTPVAPPPTAQYQRFLNLEYARNDSSSNLGLEIE